MNNNIFIPRGAIILLPRCLTQHVFQNIKKEIKMSEEKERAVYAALDFMKVKMDVANDTERFEKIFSKITDTIFLKLTEKG